MKRFSINGDGKAWWIEEDGIPFVSFTFSALEHAQELCRKLNQLKGT